MAADESTYRHKLRVRVCGLLVEEEEVLLAQIHSPVSESLIWTPPGGGLRFGETMDAGLVREFSEETNLQVKVGALLHVNELVESPYHAVEFYFDVVRQAGKAQMGRDPELSWDQQLLNDLKWIPLGQLSEIDFAPQSLMPKLRNWESRASFPIFTKG